MIYFFCNRVIESGLYEKEDMQSKLDVFLLNNRLSQEQYEELAAKIND